MVDPQTRATARSAIAAVARGDEAALERLGERAAVASPSAARAILPQGAATFRLADVRVRIGRRARGAQLVYEVSGAGRLALAEVTLVDAGTGARVEWMRIAPLARPLDRTNALTLANKGPAHLLWLASMAASLCVSLWAAASAVRGSDGWRRWSWAAAALIGVVGFKLDWTTGAMAVHLVEVGVPTAQLARIGLLGPWIATARLPLVAVFILLRARRPRQPSFAPEHADAIARP